jgi:hypothetical protein
MLDHVTIVAATLKIASSLTLSPVLHLIGKSVPELKISSRLLRIYDESISGEREFVPHDSGIAST